MDSAEALLVALVDAEAAARPDRPPFLYARTFGPSRVGHAGLPDEELTFDEPDLFDLLEEGYLRRREPSSDAAVVFDVTSSGRRRAGELRQTTRASAGGPVGERALDWNARVLPVLLAVERAYSRSPLPMGARTEAVIEELGAGANADATRLILAELVRAGYLEQTASVDQFPGPAWSRLTREGHQWTSGWPATSGEVAVDRLLAALDERIANAESEEERGRLRRLRDNAAGVGRDLLVEILANVITGG